MDSLDRTGIKLITWARLVVVSTIPILVLVDVNAYSIKNALHLIDRLWKITKHINCSSKGCGMEAFFFLLFFFKKKFTEQVC